MLLGRLLNQVSQNVPFWQKLKQHGYIVSLVPPQSYFDVQTSQFSPYVYYPPADPWHPEFTYAGRNVYVYWWVKYATTHLNGQSLLICNRWNQFAK